MLLISWFAHANCRAGLCENNLALSKPYEISISLASVKDMRSVDFLQD